MNLPLLGPLVIQSDYTILLEVKHPQYNDCRDFLASFAEIVKSPEFIHSYRITPLSLWNAAALDIPLVEIIKGLKHFSRYDMPANVLTSIREWYEIYGKLILQREVPGRLRLRVKDPFILERILHDKSLRSYWLEYDKEGMIVSERERGNLKHSLVKEGFPVKDLCGFVPGDRFDVSLRNVDLSKNEFKLRDYQTQAVESFYQAGRRTGGHGIIVMPCGSGKTIVGLGIMSKISNSTLIISTNNVAVHQWRDEIIAKTEVKFEDIGEYTGLNKSIKPITITTYQMLTYRRSKEEPFQHLQIFENYNWGLIIYDEVHLLPAPVFRATAVIQAKKRLGLTATLIREDGKEDDVFALIGPKRYDVPWKTLESNGYIATALCAEYRLELPDPEMTRYAHAPKRQQFRIAAENSRKIELVQQLIFNHQNDNILVIGQFISQLEKIAQLLKYPLITGKTKNTIREKLYSDFKNEKIKVLIVSKVANFAVDLPDANVMIQVSGTFGSRQEEAQRLGRILRPKKGISHFFTLVSKGTVEQKFGSKRQLYLVEQGYKYQIRYY